MTYFFVFLLLISCIMLILSLIKPKWGTLGKKPDLKRKQICAVYLVLAAISFVAIGALGPDTDTPSMAPASQKTIPSEISVKAGIGDTDARWQKEYGKMQGDSPKSLTVNGSKATVVFVDGRAVNITMGKRDKYYENSILKDMIPADSEVTNKEKDTSDPMLIKEKTSYHSDTLEKAYPDSKGNFVVINISDAKVKAYMNTVIDCTPSQK